MRIAIVLLAAALAPAWAQEIKLPPALEKLAAKAESSVDVTLDANMLQLAGKFLSDKDADQASAKKLVGGLKGIYVRSFEFAKEGEYSPADLDSIRTQLQSPGWSRIVGVKSKGENTDVFLRAAAEGQIGGLVILAAEPKELTVVVINGTISPDDIGKLSGQFGIPKIDVSKGKVEAPKAKGKDE
jgi:hypothetical protein